MPIKFRKKFQKKIPKNYPLHPTVKFKKSVKENSFDPFENLNEENRKLESYSYLGMVRGRLNNPSFPVPQGNKKKNLISH
jgi:transcriptional accessory protein Tex/SPT6